MTAAENEKLLRPIGLQAIVVRSTIGSPRLAELHPGALHSD